MFCSLQSNAKLFQHLALFIKIFLGSQNHIVCSESVAVFGGVSERGKNSVGASRVNGNPFNQVILKGGSATQYKNVLLIQYNKVFYSTTSFIQNVNYSVCCFEKPK